METAPRDGTDFLLYGEGWEGETTLNRNKRTITVCYYYAFENVFEVSESDGYCLRCIKPLAWMPLPEAP